MGAPHISNQPTGWFHIVHQPLDISGVTGTHLHDSNLVLLVEREQRLGHAYVIVEVALREHYLVFLGKDSSD